MLKFLLLLAICGLAIALQHKRSVESEFEDTKNRQVCTVSTKTQHIASSTNKAPTRHSRLIPVMDALDLNIWSNIADDKLLVVFVMNEWCYYSRKIMPTLEEIAVMKDANNKRLVFVLKVVSDLVDNEAADWKYGVNEVSRWPTFMFVKNGVKVEEFSGANSTRLRSTVTRLTTPPSENQDQDE